MIDYWAIAAEDDPIDYGEPLRWDSSVELEPLPEQILRALRECRQHRRRPA